MKLIDADELKLSLCRECSLFPNECLEKNGECDWNSIAHINMMKPVDAVPVRHGKWIHEVRYTIDSLHSYQQYRCSKCGMTYITNTKYCPECGARMDAERKEE